MAFEANYFSCNHSNSKVDDTDYVVGDQLEFKVLILSSDDGFSLRKSRNVMR